MTILVVRRPGAHRSADVFEARVEGDEDANAVWVGRTAAEAVGKLVIALAPTLKLRVLLQG